MDICLDTGNLEMVKKGFKRFPINSVSMNPSIAVDYLKTVDRSFLENALLIRDIIGSDTPFFLEALGDTAEEMVEDAKKIIEIVPGNTTVKIPACVEGFKAIKELTKLNIPTSCTAIYTLNQAILAAESGADYIAVYVSRLEKVGASGIDVISKIKKVFDEENYSCKIAAASLKTTEHIEKSVLAGANNLALTIDLLEKMSIHSLTQETLTKFKEDWEGLFGVGSRISNMEK
ncbi:transaldolase family protein [Amphibacillus sp. Q70]|uniref:transaldolase family protein n=1 Tax=Amphibacillus sp. Q70 TaxID=3453416 RepID=UPI003F83DFC1